jgi:hypothetical protein
MQTIALLSQGIKMNKIILITFILLSGLLFNCMGNYGSSPHTPILYSKSTHNIKESYVTGDNSPRIGTAKILKKGRACYSAGPIVNFLIHENEEGTLEKAMKDGGITKVSIVDRESMYILIVYTLYSKECINVFGE